MDGIYKNDIDYTNNQQNNILQTNEESQKDFFRHYIHLKINIY